MVNIIKNFQYDIVSKVFHWLTFLLLVAQFTLAWIMPEVHGFNPPTSLMLWHVAVGTSLLLVCLLRIIWLLFRPPVPYSYQPFMLYCLSKTTHFLLYLLLLIVPLTGLLNSSARNWSIKLVNIIPLPQIAHHGDLGWKIGESHIFLAYLILILIILHILGALYHQFFIKDNLIRRMM